MTKPEVSEFSEAVYAQLEPLQFAEEELDYPLLKYIGAIGQMLGDMDSLAQGGWIALVDVNQVPDVALAWFGQFVGVVVNPSLPYDTQRQEIRDHLGWDRGTKYAMQRELSYILGDTPFEIRERYPDAYSFTVAIFSTAGNYEYIYDTESSYDSLYNDWATYQVIYTVGSIDLINQIIAQQKPAGLVLKLELSAGADYYDILFYFDTYQSVLDYFPTYADMLAYTPEGDVITQPVTLRSVQTYLDLLDNYQTYSFVIATFTTY